MRACCTRRSSDSISTNGSFSCDSASAMLRPTRPAAGDDHVVRQARGREVDGFECLSGATRPDSVHRPPRCRPDTAGVSAIVTIAAFSVSA